MYKENFNGTDDLPCRNDVDALSKLIPSTFCPQESGREGQISEEESHLNINQSNSRLDKYLFYFSSRL